MVARLFADAGVDFGRLDLPDTADTESRAIAASRAAPVTVPRPTTASTCPTTPLREEAMLDRRPTCGKTIGTPMESHSDTPGLVDLWRAWIEGQRDAMTLLAVFGSRILLALLAVDAEALVR